MSESTKPKSVKLSDFPTTLDTPFINIEDIKYRKYWNKERGTEWQDKKTGETHMLVKPGELVTGFKDTAAYTKLFKSGKLKLAELSSAGTKVLCYVMINAKPNEEEICLHPQLVATEMGYKDPRSVYEGLVDLLSTGLLGRKTGYQSCFWLNPNLFFNGDRIKLLDNPIRAGFVEDLMSKYTKQAKDYVDGLD